MNAKYHEKLANQSPRISSADGGKCASIHSNIRTRPARRGEVNFPGTSQWTTEIVIIRYLCSLSFLEIAHMVEP
jgi:hypothetical protein